MRLLCCSGILVALVACGTSTNRTTPGSSIHSSHRKSKARPTPPVASSKLDEDELTPQLGSMTSSSSNGSGGSSGGFIMSNQPSPPPTANPPPQAGGSSLSPSRPPSREPPPSNPNSGGFILAQPTSTPPPPPPRSSSSNDPDVERARAVLVAAAFERALNASDTSGAEKLSTTSCWSRECASIARQAQTKFKVKLLPGVSQVGTHGLAEMDVLCGGTRQCDKVWLLLEKDCMSGTRFVVSDVTEDKSKRDGWLKSAPAMCGSSATVGTATSSGATSPQAGGGDVRTGATNATKPVPDADRVIAGLRPRLRVCYTTGLKADPKMSGRVTYTISVAGDGSVVTANVSSNNGIAFDVVTCQVGVLKRAQFSAPGGTGSTLTVPLVLSP